MKNKSTYAHPTEMIPTLEELVTGITPENRYGEISMGPDRGKEIVEWDPSAVSDTPTS